MTRKTDYALVAMADMARRNGQVASAREIGERFGIPVPMLTNILKELVCKELVVSTRGTRGGYRLSRPAERITLVEILEASDGPVRLALCCSVRTQVDQQQCELEQVCPTKDPIRKLHGLLVDLLSQVTLADLACDQVSVSLRTPGPAKEPLVLA